MDLLLVVPSIYQAQDLLSDVLGCLANFISNFSVIVNFVSLLKLWSVRRKYSSTERCLSNSEI